MKNFKVEYNVYNLTTTTTEVESNSEYTEAETKEEAVANVIQCLHDQALNNGYESEIKEDKLVFENEEFFNFTATEEKTGGKIMSRIFVKETNGGTFVLSLNVKEDKGIVYSDYDVMQITGKDPAELTSEDLEQFDYQGCIDYGEGYDAFEGDALQDYLNLPTVKEI